MSAESENGFDVLVVDDEESMRFFVRRALERAGHRVEAVSNAAEALDAVKERPFDVVVTDLRMPGMNGHELHAELLREKCLARVVLMTGFGTVKDAVSAINAGAEAYITKPFEAEELLASVQRAGEKARLLIEVGALRAALECGAFEGLVGNSREMRTLVRTIANLAPRNGTVLISGESGTGKELVARAIHARSERSAHPFVALHCGALPQGLLESELFGVEAGAFTGADRTRIGYAERADKGTLFLDEVGEIPLQLQPALLRFLQSGEVVRVGGSVVLHPDVRVIACSHFDLREFVRNGKLRQDLFFRLNVLPVQVPPLRTHREDIPLLVRSFLGRLGQGEALVSTAAMAGLCAHIWPGNVRELRNAIERMLALKPGGSIEVEDLPEECRGGAVFSSTEPGYRETMETFERRYLEDLLTRTGGNVAEASRMASIPRASLHARISTLKVDLSRFRPAL
ncbi:MAG: sigma-54-dependent Fis family transcriptional regulator [Planctomycetes bacterium]|nr:sigma-54-dependent Fis family transcriptional regulator [Planctomycetota bacterium]